MIVHTNVEAQLDGTDCRLVELTETQDTMRVDTLGGSKPDPEWAVRDEAGHIHRWYGDVIPTATVETVTKFCYDCGDDHDETGFRCRWCRERIFPVYIVTGPESTQIPGLVTIRATVKYPNDAPHLEFAERLLLTSRGVACVVTMTDWATNGDGVTVELVGVEAPMRRP